MIQAIIEWDKEIFYALNGFRTDFLNTIMPVLSLTWLLWALCSAVFIALGIKALLGKAKWKNLKPVLFGAVLLLATVGVTDLVTRAAKHYAGRLRPYQSLPFAHFQTKKGWRQNSEVFTSKKPRADSFFSGHAAHSMAVAATAATLCPPLAPIIYAMPVAVGYSRVYLGKHYPSDVLCGWLASVFIALLARRLTRNYRAKIRPE